MGALGDGQASDEYTVSICAKDSSGPYHYALRKHLVELAKTNHIEYKVDIYPYYGSDASAAIRAGFDVKHALIGRVLILPTHLNVRMKVLLRIQKH